MFRDRIRVFNKYVTNRITHRLAYRSRGPFAFIGHTGRRSGKHYETIIMVIATNEGFVIALTYGPGVDWYKNIVAAGGGTIYWHKKRYTIGVPEPMDAHAATALFPALEKVILRLVGLKDFVLVKTIEDV